MDERERYEEYLQDESEEQLSIYSVSHLLSKLSDYSRIISENGIAYAAPREQQNRG